MSRSPLGHLGLNPSGNTPQNNSPEVWGKQGVYRLTPTDSLIRCRELLGLLNPWLMQAEPSHAEHPSPGKEMIKGQKCAWDRRQYSCTEAAPQRCHRPRNKDRWVKGAPSPLLYLDLFATLALFKWPRKFSSIFYLGSSAILVFSMIETQLYEVTVVNHSLFKTFKPEPLCTLTKHSQRQGFQILCLWLWIPLVGWGCWCTFSRNNVVALTVLLSYNVHTIKFMHLKCTI